MGTNILTNIRKPTITDINYLLDIDLKSFDDPLDIETWRSYCTDPELGTLVGTFYSVPIGYVIWGPFPNEDAMNIYRIAVKPKYRRQGIGTRLIKAVEIVARQAIKTKLRIIVPESLCCPGNELDVSQWLIRRGFHTQKGILRGVCKYCGQIEDGFIFLGIVGGIR